MSRGIEQATRIFKELRGEILKLSPQYFAVTGLSRGESFALIYTEACKFERALAIEQRRESNGNKITERQIRYINTLQADDSSVRKTVYEYLQQRGKDSIEELTKQEASELIDKILKGGEGE